MVGERAGSKSSLWVNGVIERTEIEGKRKKKKGKESVAGENVTVN